MIKIFRFRSSVSELVQNKFFHRKYEIRIQSQVHAIL